MPTSMPTHPWISFNHSLERVSPALWMLLGEARSKCGHLSWVPLAPDVWQQLHTIYLAKGALATTAIEGNTLSEEEVKKHLSGELKLPPSQEYLAKEISNIVHACNQILAEIAAGAPVEPTPDQIRTFNRQVLDGLTLDEGVMPGEIRRHGVGVARYRAPAADECGRLLEQLCQWLNSGAFRPDDDDMKVVCGILRAVLAHLYIAWIHPFGDGNGRTARLVEFQILVAAGVPVPAAHLMSDHYNRTRTEYYRQLDRASASGGDVIPFLHYAVRGFVDGLREQLDRIQLQVLETTWENYVHSMFHHRESPADRRRRHLILDLSKKDPIAPGDVKDLSPRIAAAYAGRTIRTIQRDFRILESMGLVTAHDKGKYRAKREEILMRRPFTHRPTT